MTHSISYRRILTRMGYYDYQNGFINRHLIQGRGWDDHLNQCRDFIIRAIEYYKPERVTVLGSGWLLELPVKELIEKTELICLVDIVHPPDVIGQTGHLTNVELKELDITGGLIQMIWNETRKYPIYRKMNALGDIIIPEFRLDFDPGMVISLNIITQLESILISYLKKKSKIKEEELYTFRAEIQKRHFDFLKKHRSLLISDIAEITTNKSGNVTVVPTLLTDLPAGQLRGEWTWNFDQTGADFYNRTTIFKVVAITI